MDSFVRTTVAVAFRSPGRRIVSPKVLMAPSGLAKRVTDGSVDERPAVKARRRKAGHCRPSGELAEHASLVAASAASLSGYVCAVHEFRLCPACRQSSARRLSRCISRARSVGPQQHQLDADRAPDNRPPPRASSTEPCSTAPLWLRPVMPSAAAAPGTEREVGPPALVRELGNRRTRRLANCPAASTFGCSPSTPSAAASQRGARSGPPPGLLSTPAGCAPLLSRVQASRKTVNGDAAHPVPDTVTWSSG